MKNFGSNLLGGAGVAALAAVAAINTVYVVGQTQQAVVLRFGRPVRVETAPGLYAKWPLAERAVRMDTRSRPVEAEQTEIVAADRGRLMVDAFMRYRIRDPQRFYRTLGDARTAEEQLQGLLAASLKRTLAAFPTTDIVAGTQDGPIRATLDDLRHRTAAQFGIEISDVRLRHAELPTAQAEAVYRRMRSEGEQQVAQIRADSDRRRADIVADANRQVAAIRGDAEGQALRIRGEGDAQRIAVLGAAYGRDPAFARYFRQMEAYQNTLTQGDATLILSPDNAFLRDFGQGPTGR